MKDKIKVAIYGASGYTSSELLRLLEQHPQAQVCAVVSHSQVGKCLGELHPHLGEELSAMEAISAEQVPDCDCVFFATPAGIAIKEAGRFLDKGVKVIDLSPDFRIKDAKLWQQWYAMEHGAHGATDLLAEAVYGLPEANRAAIKKARLIANPGCYATTVQLALLPSLLSAKHGGQLSGKELVVDAKSGVSGAGKSMATHLLLGEAGEDFTCYAAEGHRHQPEMEESLREKSGVDVKLRFVPHLLPLVRGIFVDIYLPLGGGGNDGGIGVGSGSDGNDNGAAADELRTVYSKFYAAEPFVKVLAKGQAPHIKHTRGSNHCHLAIFAAPGSTYIQVCGVLDNLVKGASGQAIQNMNITFGLDEKAGLQQAALTP